MKFEQLKEECEKLRLKFDPSMDEPDYLPYPPDIDGLEIKNIILQFGLNPSSKAKEEKWHIPKDCFLCYVPLNPGIKGAKKVMELLNNENAKLVYNRYFKPIYEQQTDPTNLLWENEKYLSKINFFEEKKVDNEIKEYIKEYKRQKNTPDAPYLLFTDLIFVNNKAGGEIANMMNSSPDLQESVIKFYKLQIDYYRPKLVILNPTKPAKYHIIDRLISIEKPKVLNHEFLSCGASTKDKLENFRREISIERKKLNL